MLETLCILEPDAAGAECPLALLEQRLARRVVEIDAEVVGEHEFDLAHSVQRSGALSHFDFHLAGRDRFPVDRLRRDNRCLVRPLGYDFIALLAQIDQAFAEYSRSGAAIAPRRAARANRD